MKIIFFKEFHSFYSSFIGFITVSLFVLITGILLWVVPSYSVLDYGYATLETFFDLAPILLMIIIPAITMKLYSEEYQSGTIEWLYTKPLSEFDILMGKYLASVAVMMVSLLPTLVYYFSVYALGSPIGNVDSGGVFGSYFGLSFLVMSFCAIGIFASSLAQNQIVAFITAILLNAVFFWSFGFVSELLSHSGFLEFVFQYLGMSYHYRSISRGVVDTRDVIYFLSVVSIFLFLTHFIIDQKKS
ncbi:MAG: ABC transporter permease subunit [Chitinophagales bacterium]|jgi:ABC-2 type transport system permease protein|nr:ABC transporter permease subunit [Chitinophagales bacterium]